MSTTTAETGERAHQSESEMTVAAAAVEPAASPLPPLAGPWSPAYRLMTLGLLITILGAAFEALAVATIMPATVNDLGGLSLYGWSFSAFMLTNLIGLAIAGGEADLQGPARPFLIGSALFVVGLLIGGLAPTMLVLIAGRAVQGFGAGFISSVVYVAVGRGYPTEARPRMLALMSSAWVVPGLIGPAIAGLVADYIGWRWVFLALVPVPLLAAFMALPALRRIPGGDQTTRDHGRIVRSGQLALGAGMLLAGPGQSNLLFGVALSIAGVALAWPALARLLPAGTVRAAVGLPAAIATMALLNFGFFGVDIFIPLGLTEIRDRSVAFAGLALTAATITWTAGAWIQSRYVLRVSRRLLVQTGLVLIVIGSAGATLALLPAVPVIASPLAWGVAGLGMGIAFSTISLVVLETAPMGQEGAATSSMQLGIVLATALAAGIGGAFIDALGADRAAIRTSLIIQDLLMIGVLLAAILVAARLPVGVRPSPRRCAPPHPEGTRRCAGEGTTTGAARSAATPPRPRKGEGAGG